MPASPGNDGTDRRAIIVDRQVSAWCIMVSPDAPLTTAHAGRELRDLIERIAGVGLPLVPPAPRRSPAIELVEDATLPDQAFRITVEPQRIEIRGSGNGVLYGAYALLERLGCRFMVPGDDCVPRLESISLPLGTFEESPDTRWRMVRLIMCPKEAEPHQHALNQIQWCGRNRVNHLEVPSGWDALTGPLDRRPLGCRDTYAQLEEAALAHGVRLIIGAHSFFSWCSPDDYFVEHPDYFSLIDGQRKPVQLCLSNPRVERLIADRITAYLEEHPAVGGVGLTPMDGDQWCDCPACLKADEPATMAGGPFHRLRSRSRSLFSFVDRVANRIGARFPDRYVCTYAYVHYTEPPANFRFTARNVAVLLTWYWNCGSHALDVPDCETAAFYGRAQEAWLRCLGGTGLLLAADYHYGMSAWSLLPWPALRVSARNWQHSIPRGVQPFAFQYYKADTILYRLTDHLWARFVWRVGEAPRWPIALAEACEAHLGSEAGRLVAEYVLEWERLGESYVGHLLPSVDKCLLDLVDRGALARLNSLAQRVRAIPASPMRASRVSQFLWQHELFVATWECMWHRARADDAAKAGDTATAHGHWQKTVAAARRAMDHWPENPGLIRHARSALIESQAAIGQSANEIAVQSDDQVAARMLDAVTDPLR